MIVIVDNNEHISRDIEILALESYLASANYDVICYSYEFVILQSIIITYKGICKTTVYKWENDFKNFYE